MDSACRQGEINRSPRAGTHASHVAPPFIDLDLEASPHQTERQQRPVQPSANQRNRFGGWRHLVVLNRKKIFSDCTAATRSTKFALPIIQGRTSCPACASSTTIPRCRPCPCARRSPALQVEYDVASSSPPVRRIPSAARTRQSSRDCCARPDTETGSLAPER